MKNLRGGSGKDHQVLLTPAPRCRSGKDPGILVKMNPPEVIAVELNHQATPATTSSEHEALN